MRAQINVGMNVPEHSNLRLDVSPFARGFQLVSQSVVQDITHADDSVSHSLDLSLPVIIAP